MRVVVLFLISLMLSLNVNALAVASDYYNDNTLELIEETSKIFSIRLQNPDSYESRVKVDYDKQLMKAIDFKEEYALPPQSSTRIEFNVTAPQYDKNNNLFVISYTVHQLSAGGGGGIPFLTRINKSFKLKVIENPNKFHINYIKSGYIAILVLIALFVLRKLKKPKDANVSKIQKIHKALKKKRNSRHPR